MTHDELVEIDGVKPNVWLADGEEREIGSATSKAKYKIKHTFDHFYCSCPAWRNQSRAPVNARTCKHLKALLGDEYEAARIALKKPDTLTLKASEVQPKATSSRARPASKRKRTENEDSSEGKEENTTLEKEEHITSARPVSKRPKTEPVSEGVGEQKGEDRDEAQDGGDKGGGHGVDELMEINGVKPNIVMEDGDQREVSSLTSNSKYKIKRTWDHYYCSCPAWRNQGGLPVNARTCKHLKNLLGEEYENARLLWKNPDGPQPTTTRGKGKANNTDSNKAPALLLANKWDLDDDPDPTGWWISEKLDGVRTYFDGKQMVSRLGNPFTPPQWFLDNLPKDVTLDGELFGGRGEFQSTVSIVKTVNSPHWKSITFQVFDIPSRGNDPFEARLAFLKELFGPGGSHHSEWVVVVEHEQARDRQHVLDKLKEVESLGGEGLMLRKSQSLYEGHRSSTLFKIKTFYDAEAIVMGYLDGKGKHKGATGALKCKMASGKTFNVGTGLSDKQRRSPPEIGTIIVYRFQELTKDGVPRFPSFVGIAADKEEPKDAEISENRRNGTKSLDV